jgi:hypothetical protein
MGLDNRWTWPDRRPYANWYDEERDSTVEALVRLFRTQGYEVCEGCDLEPGFEKIAIYAKNRVPTHVARQIGTGEWTSKCGRLEDITHVPQGLEGSEYGEVAVALRRASS